MKLKRFEYAVAVAVLALVAGCGGGGGGGDGGSATPNPGGTSATGLTVGGTVTGLRAGATVTLTNGGESLSVPAGAFTFATRVNTGTAYDIKVTPPGGYTCQATNSVGMIGNANSTSTVVDCAPLVLAGVRGSLQAPLAVVGDGTGNMYVTDGSLHGVLKLASTGALGIVAGGTGQPGLVNGTGGAARFWLNSSGATVDSQGTLFIADGCNGAIRKMTAAGEVSTLAGDGSASCYNDNTASSGPAKVDATGTAARFEGPQSLASDGAGGVFVIDKNAGLTIRRVTADGVVTTTAYANPDDVAPVTMLQTIARASDNTLYVSDESDRIWKVASNGTLVLHAGSYGSSTLIDGTGGAARFAAITAMTTTPNGDLYVTDFASVRKVTPAGVVTTLAGSLERGDLDAQGTAARFGNLLSIGFDGKDLFVVDSGQEVLRKVTLDGKVTTMDATPAVRKSINGDATTARFASFSSLAADAQGNMYFVDPLAHIVRKATPDGSVTLFAGLEGTAGISVPGSAPEPLASARFASPQRVATGRDGSIWIAQSLGLRRIKDGVVTTVDASVRPVGIAIDADGNAIVTTGVVSGEVLRITPSGAKTVLVQKSQVAALTGRADAKVIPQSVAVDAAGNIYFADTGTVAVYKLAKTGELTLFAGTPFKETGNIDGPVNTATLGFYDVDHMTADDAGNLYLSGHGNVRKISPAGVVSTPSFLWGNAPIGGITFNKGKLIGMTRYAVLQEYLQQ
jgi:sugar lactone lactonase YvrE